MGGGNVASQKNKDALSSKGDKNLKMSKYGLIFSCISALSTIPALADINLDNPIIDRITLEAQDDRFEFNNDGLLMTGPTRALGQPIDFSSIIKEAYIKGGFFDSITGCFPKIDYCGFEVRKFSSRAIRLKSDLGPTASSEISMIDIVTITKSSIGLLGFEISQTQDQGRANVIVTVGSTDFIRTRADENSDNLVIQSLANWSSKDSDRSFIKKLLGTSEARPFCYVSTKSWLEQERVEIYANISGVSRCLPQSYFTAVGFYPTLFETPSLGNLSMQYTAPTFADQLYVDVLYNERFPLNLTIEKMKDFWIEESAKVWRKTLENDLGAN
jgi:hypothetical protein